MAKNCEYNYGGECDNVATTTLQRNNGEVQQLCEAHRNVLINLLRSIADGVIKTHRNDGEAEANHWFVLNKIPK